MASPAVVPGSKPRRTRRSLADEEAGDSSTSGMAGAAAGLRERGDTELSAFVTGADLSTSSVAGGARGSGGAAEEEASAGGKGKEGGDAATTGGGSGGLLRREALLSFFLALIMYALVPPTAKHDFNRLEYNGFALCAATAPGSHWGNWRSLTRCDCKAFHHCYASLLQSNETASRTMKLVRLFWCLFFVVRPDRPISDESIYNIAR